MTQITMDNYFTTSEENETMTKPTKETPTKETTTTRPSSMMMLMGSSSVKSQSGLLSTTSTSVMSSETPKQRIKEILRKDLWHRDDTSVVCTATEELAKFIIGGGTSGSSYHNHTHNHRSYIVQCGGVMALLKLLEEYTNHEMIQYYTLRGLEQLALGEEETQIAISEMDGIPLVVQSMQQHPTSLRVQAAARAALASICSRRNNNNPR